MGAIHNCQLENNEQVSATQMSCSYFNFSCIYRVIFRVLDKIIILAMALHYILWKNQLSNNSQWCTNIDE